MISVGIDISKRKSTAAILNVQGEVKFIIEATGIYHLALLEFLKSKGYFVYVADPLLIKQGTLVL